MTGADGRDALELVQAIYRAAETGQRVSLPLAR
jgi:predicted dehydrogenase